MPYPGGKGGSGVVQRLINEIPPHDVYIEACAGGAALFRAKRPAKENILIDLDPAALEAIPTGHAPDTVKIHGSALDYLRGRSFGAKTVFIYFDPPYILETRKKNNRPLYRCEFTDQDHQALLDLVCELSCMVMISGYRHPLYDHALPEWRTYDFQAMTHAGLATETLWLNYPQPVMLHDYSKLGEDYRERERIAKKRKRWVANLRNMAPLERLAILSALNDEATTW